MSEMTTDMSALKEKLKKTWISGDYGIVAKNLEASAAEFLARVPFAPGTRVLDVACGTGQIAFPAARGGARVTGIDIAPNLIDQARARAEAEGLDIRFDTGDAEAMPYEDASFDLVISLIGAMFAPRPERVAAELLRVCRPGGRVVMGNWTPGGFIGKMFRTVAGHHPPSPLMPSPLQWGEEATVRRRLSDGVSDLRLTHWMYPFRYPYSASKVVEHYRTYFGPTIAAFNALEEPARAALSRDLERLWAAHNRSTDGGTIVEAEILEVVAVRAGGTDHP